MILFLTCLCIIGAIMSMVFVWSLCKIASICQVHEDVWGNAEQVENKE